MITGANSAANVISTAALVIKSFLDVIKEEIPGLKYVYDEKLSYPTAVEAFRANNDMTGEVTELYPLFAFKRSVLRYPTNAPGRRSIVERASRKISNTISQQYRTLHGEFDLNFLYVTKKMEDLERFEVAYLSEEGIPGHKEFNVDLTSELGEIFTYFATYGILDDKVIESEGHYFKIVTGKVTLRGFFPVLRGDAKHITQITLKIRTFLGEILVDTHVL
jgi:hypothetical protein